MNKIDKLIKQRHSENGRKSWEIRQKKYTPEQLKKLLSKAGKTKKKVIHSIDK
jgi:polyribonucleotide nucleotidyltransferase